MVKLGLTPEAIKQEIENVDRKVIVALRGNGMIASKHGSFPVTDDKRFQTYLQGRNYRAVYAGCKTMTMDDYIRMAGVTEMPSGYVPLSTHRMERRL